MTLDQNPTQQQQLRSVNVERERLAGVLDAQCRIVHDLGNINMVVDGCCAIMEGIFEDAHTHSARETLDELRAEIQQMRAAMDHMRNLQLRHRQLTRPGSARRRRQVHRVADLLENIRSCMSWGHPSKVITDCPLNLLVHADEIDISRILVNLITNARHAFDAAERTDGIVTLTARRRGDQVVIRIQDNGPGIPDHVRARVFDTSYSTKVGPAQSGLGLAICKELATANDGDIELLAPGRTGTTFALTLPACDEQIVSLFHHA